MKFIFTEMQESNEKTIPFLITWSEQMFDLNNENFINYIK